MPFMNPVFFKCGFKPHNIRLSLGDCQMIWSRRIARCSSLAFGFEFTLKSAIIEIGRLRVPLNSGFLVESGLILSTLAFWRCCVCLGGSLR